MVASIELGWTVPELAPPPKISRKRRWDDDHHRMVQLMLGQLERSGETLDLLGAASSCTRPFESLELDFDAPLPSGWEKCLDLKTGSIYYINRSTGTSTSWHPKKPTVADLNSPPSPSSSGLTHEASAMKISHQPNVKMHKRADDFWAGTSGVPPAIVGDGRLQLGLSLSVDLNSIPEEELHEASPRSTVEYTPLSERACIQKCGDVCTTVSSSSSSSCPSTINFQELDGSAELVRERHLQGRVCDVEIMNSEAASMMTVGCAKCLMFVMLSRTDPKCPKCGTCTPLDFLKPVAKKSKFGFAT